MKNLLKREISKQFFKFCLIGVTITVFAYLIFLILFYFLSFDYLFAAAIGFIAGTLLGFIFNKIYTFRSKEKSLITMPQYFLLYLFSLIFYLLTLKLLVEILNFNLLISILLVQVLIVLINFFGSKIIVFKNKKW